MAPAKAIVQRKYFLRHFETDRQALLIIDVWDVALDQRYPQGVKFSYFLVWPESNEIILGYDNHYPKGLHRHEAGVEVLMKEVDYLELLVQFEIELTERGFKE